MRPAIDAVLMIFPPEPWEINCRAASCIPISTPNTLTFMMRSKFSSVTSSSFIGEFIPALLKRASSLPNSSTVAVIPSLTWSRLVTSMVTAKALPPAAVISSASELASALSRSLIDTAAPSAANPRHNAAPIPDAPPVTMMTRPASRPAMMILLWFIRYAVDT